MNELIGASLSKPHTSVIALVEVCVCLLVCSRPNFKWAYL